MQNKLFVVIPLTVMSGDWLGYVRTSYVSHLGTNKVSCTMVHMYPKMSGMTEWKRLPGHIAWGVD